MCNVAGDGDGECGGERLMVNAVGDDDVESGGERKRLRGYVLTLMWNAPENGNVGVQRVIL